MDKLPHSANLDKWRLFMEECPAPSNYIDFGFYYMIGAALQRRVWFGDEHKPLFCNPFIVFVGPSGVGKGAVINPMSSILREHKLRIQKPQTEKQKDESHKVIEAALLEGNSHKEVKDIVEGNYPPVIPIAANATSYAALVKCMAESVRHIDYIKNGKKTIYAHSSLAYCNEELGSILREKSSDVMNFLQEAYDCNELYEYDTIKRGKCSIRKICLSFLAGTTPDFMESAFDDALINQGFSSRSMFIVAYKNRFFKAIFTKYTEDQLKARKDIVERVRLLTTIVGSVDFAPDAMLYFKNWWEKQEANSEFRVNQSSKLDAYYARKNIHVMKMAMILHFADVPFEADGKCSMIVPIECFVKAIAILREAEKLMHLALTFGGDNPQYKVGMKIIRYLKRHPEGKTFKELFLEFYEYANSDALKEILIAMEMQNRLRKENLLHKETQQIIETLYKPILLAEGVDEGKLL